MASSTISGAELPRMAANALRALAMDGVQKANSGHPGMPMGMADIATVLWSRFLSHNPVNPRWLNRDRFVLSNGHGSMLLYSLLHLTGYGVPMSELQRFRQLHSMTPGHPEYREAPGVEVTTGPLGQGISNAVGMALAERWLAARFNRPGHEIIDHFTYAFSGDGCMEEGVSHESCSLAGHLGLGKLIVLYDNNGITIDGETKLSFSEKVTDRFRAYGWHVQDADGHDQQAVTRAIEAARAETGRPSLIACRTVIGFGAPTLAGSEKTHGSPLGAEEVAGARKKLGWPWPPFEVPQEILDFWRQALERGRTAETEWAARLSAYRKAFPAEGAELARIVEGRASQAWQAPLEALRQGWLKEAPPADATRAASGKVLDTIGMTHPDLLGGSADLTPSNNTRAKGFGDIAPGKFAGKYVRYGVREHGMGAIMNGLALHGGAVPYAGTFLTFSDYMRPAIRLAALMKLQVIYVFTHDSIGLGEDGPTHQAVEHYAALRAIPNLYVIRPGDTRETLEAWQVALARQDGPTALLLTRQKIPTLPGTGAGGLAKGGYVLAEPPAGLPLQALLLGTGSELHLALGAHDALAKDGIGARVISMPCWELFEAQPEAYKQHLLPRAVECRVAIEAGVAQGWERYLGGRHSLVGMKSFGASAPAEELFKHFDITVEAVVRAAKRQLAS
ncbi:MAG: transketolase [Candidatus Lambdaproteobacteria bacterium]|nr:transketolase [Candidatus Lambdaproteobacteria bacterium]